MSFTDDEKERGLPMYFKLQNADPVYSIVQRPANPDLLTLEGTSQVAVGVVSLFF